MITITLSITVSEVFTPSVGTQLTRPQPGTAHTINRLLLRDPARPSPLHQYSAPIGPQRQTRAVIGGEDSSLVNSRVSADRVRVW